MGGVWRFRITSCGFVGICEPRWQTARVDTSRILQEFKQISKYRRLSADLAVVVSCLPILGPTLPIANTTYRLA